MIKNPRLTSLALALALTHAAGASLAADQNWQSQMMKPNRAVGLDVGSKHVVGYFLKKDGVCKLTAMFSDKDDVESDAAQLQLEVHAGETARITAAEGNSLQFVCLGRAEAMTATVLDRLALRTDAD